ncbi:oligosaccharide flippase family protein [Marinifilum caeruleilacunae]|uniref:Polysaccharide biosynthesis protein n=1 Tax=Marinifilum caeruleilacunae TaxID=2499076 RepID=A0ABX1WVQ9_9BACT|nr:oligosaccharide flippase family protein [Marinifilum caeruleilacunae]NOU59990.1 polysaccharide biosynthesis protein [Marinifilum caeruleilacunae]
MQVNQLKVGAILSYVVIGLSNIVGLLYTPYMLRMMGQSEYGLYSLVASVVAYLTILDLGFGNTIIRYTAKFRSEGKIEEQYSMFGMFVVLYSLIGLVVLILGMGLYFNIDTLYGDTLTPEELEKVHILVLLMVFNLVFTFPVSIFGSIVTAYEKFVFQKVVQIARIILNPLIMIILLEMGYRAIGMVVLITIFNVATQLINLWYCRNKIKIKIRFKKFDWSFFKELAGYSFFIFLNAIIDRLYWSSGQLVLGANVGTAAVAMFAVAIQLEQMYMGFSTAISGVFLPKVTAMVSQSKSNKEISDLFIRTGRIQFIVMAFILAGFILFGRQFIYLWAGADYTDTYVITLLMFIPLTIPLIQNLGITILQARNRLKFRAVLYLCIAIFSVVMQLLLVDTYGGIGCGIAICSGLVLGHIIIMNIYYFKRQDIDIPKFWKEIGKMAISPALLGLLTYWVISQVDLDTPINLAIAICTFSVIYIPIFWMTSMNNYERDLLYKPVKSLVTRLKPTS